MWFYTQLQYALTYNIVSEISSQIKLCFYTGIAIGIANELHVSNTKDKTKTECGRQVSLSFICHPNGFKNCFKFDKVIVLSVTV